MLRDVGLAVVEGQGAVEHAAVVPDDEVAGLPGMPVDAGRPAGVLEEVVQQLLGRLGSKAGDAVGVAADQQGRPAGYRVDLPQRAKRRAKATWSPLLGC